MGRYPHDPVILAMGPVVLDCSLVSNMAIMQHNVTGKFFVTVGFVGSDRVIYLGVTDHEEAMVVRSWIHRAMIASRTGDHGLVDGFNASPEEDD